MQAPSAFQRCSEDDINQWEWNIFSKVKSIYPWEVTFIICSPLLVLSENREQQVTCGCKPFIYMKSVIKLSLRCPFFSGRPVLLSLPSAQRPCCFLFCHLFLFSEPFAHCLATAFPQNAAQSSRVLERRNVQRACVTMGVVVLGHGLMVLAHLPLQTKHPPDALARGCGPWESLDASGLFSHLPSHSCVIFHFPCMPSFLHFPWCAWWSFLIFQHLWFL